MAADEQGLPIAVCGFEWDAQEGEACPFWNRVSVTKHRCVTLTNRPEHNSHTCGCGVSRIEEVGVSLTPS